MPSLDRDTFYAEMDRIIEREEETVDPLAGRDQLLEEVMAGTKNVSEIKERTYFLD